jgi:uncharacterized membrane-anchored protein
MMRTALVIGGLVVVLGLVNLQIVQKERLLESGASMLLELAPVDPRSLIQGDYMQLDYAIARDLRGRADWPRDGALVVTLDGDGVARLVRRHESGVALGPGEHLLQYRVRNGRVRIATDAFFFQEGHAGRYTSARYGDLKVDASGTAILVALRDAARRPLGSAIQPSTPVP